MPLGFTFSENSSSLYEQIAAQVCIIVQNSLHRGRTSRQ